MVVAINGDERGSQHLDSKLLPNGCGETIASHVKTTLGEWGVTTEKPETIPSCQVFDTTSSNTGI
jgi:hypothetical protein